MSAFGQKTDFQTGLDYDFGDIFRQIRAGLAPVRPDVELVHLSELYDGIEWYFDPAKLEGFDAYICDTTTGNMNVMYILGWLHSESKPIVLVSSQSAIIPDAVAPSMRLQYGDSIDPEFASDLGRLLDLAKENPSPLMARDSSHEPPTVFISYSHEDRPVLDRLSVHLRPLERRRLIDPWDDRRLRAGDEWSRRIQEAINRASIAILIFSADYMASDFIVDNELPPILDKASGTKIKPLIAKPCRFGREQRLGKFQSFNDPERPLSLMTEHEQEALYDQVAREVERYVTTM